MHSIEGIKKLNAKGRDALGNKNRKTLEDHAEKSAPGTRFAKSMKKK